METVKMNRPLKQKNELIQAERDAEAGVVHAEVLLKMELAIGTPESVAAEQAKVDEARANSLRIRQEMQDGLEEWTRYSAYEEAVRQAAVSGVTLNA